MTIINNCSVQYYCVKFQTLALVEMKNIYIRKIFGRCVKCVPLDNLSVFHGNAGIHGIYKIAGRRSMELSQMTTSINWMNKVEVSLQGTLF